MPPRLFIPQPIAAGVETTLGDAATRHAQVLRLQPDDPVTLFDGQGGEWSARIASMGKRESRVQVIEHRAVERELPVAVTLALSVPTGARMDFVVEKATELGVAEIQPLTSERSVLRLAGERADKRRAHWQAIAVAADGGIYVGGDVPGDHRVAAAHHERPPDQEHRQLAQADALQRNGGGVVEQHERNARRGKGGRGPAALHDKIRHDGDADGGENRQSGRQDARIEHAARERMHRVAHARRIGRVVAALVAEVIVAEVADHVGDDESEQHQDESAQVEFPGGQREEPGDDRGLRRDHQDDAARRIQELRYRVQPADLFGSGPVSR